MKEPLSLFTDSDGDIVIVLPHVTGAVWSSDDDDDDRYLKVITVDSQNYGDCFRLDPEDGRAFLLQLSMYYEVRER